MDTPNPSAFPTFASKTPLHIGRVGLKVRDLETAVAFYTDVLGLTVLARVPGSSTLGAGSVALVELAEAVDAQPDDKRSAGLYHTAFLMPTRADLARWILHAASRKVPLTGASDHEVSEAIYLDDPEGNGIEVYSDRPPQRWHWTGSDLRMITEPLDVDDILREISASAEYPRAPDGLRIGHVHLRVGDITQAEGFYRDGIGLDVTRRRHGASFMSSGRYHHHIACNVWHSAGAGARDSDRAGLSWLSLAAADQETFAAAQQRVRQAGISFTAGASGIELADPWGTRIRIVQP